MGQTKTPGTMLQDGHNGTNVKVVLAAGTYPWTILHVPDWSGKGCFHWTSPEAQAPGSDATSRAFPYTVESEDFGEKESIDGEAALRTGTDPVILFCSGRGTLGGRDDLFEDLCYTGSMTLHGAFKG